MFVLAHGLEGSPNGTKAQALRGTGVELVAPDGRQKVLADRLPYLEAAIVAGAALDEPLVLVGSSYGGLAAAWLAEQYADCLSGLVLMAPALHYSEEPVTDAAALSPPPGLQVVIIHAVNDDVVPIEASRLYRDKAPDRVTLHEVDDGHRLSGHHDLMVTEAMRLHRFADAEE